MYTTSISLIERLRRPGEEAAWERMVDLYAPLLYFWAQRMGLAETDVADMVQEVFTVLVQKLPDFRYDRNKSFRGWLRTILVNRWRDNARRHSLEPEAHEPRVLEQLAHVDAPEPFEEAEYRQYLVGRALDLMRREFQPTTWQACWDVVVSERPAAAVAAQLGITVDAVYAAKSRVLRRLRQELSGLMD